MSVVVKCDMPKICTECPFVLLYDVGYTCPFTGKACSPFDKLDDCPIIAELPEEHGEYIELPSVIGWDKSDVKRYADTFVGGAMWLFDKLTEREVKIPAEYKNEDK